MTVRLRATYARMRLLDAWGVDYDHVTEVAESARSLPPWLEVDDETAAAIHALEMCVWTEGTISI